MLFNKSDKRKFLSKKGAMELSISTVVVIVLGIFMLILGIVLIRSISQNATKSVDSIDKMTNQQLSALFGETEGNIAFNLGPDSTAKIEAGADDTFGIALRATTEDGSSVTRTRLTYKLSLDEGGSKNCASAAYLGEQQARNLFITPLDRELQFDKYDGANAYSLIQLKVPKGTTTCSQKVWVDVTDTETDKPLGGSYFVVEVAKPKVLGIF